MEDEIKYVEAIEDRALQDRLQAYVASENARRQKENKPPVHEHAFAVVVGSNGHLHAAFYEKTAAVELFGQNPDTRIYALRGFMVPWSSPLYAGDII